MSVCFHVRVNAHFTKRAATRTAPAGKNFNVFSSRIVRKRRTICATITSYAPPSPGSVPHSGTA